MSHAKFFNITLAALYPYVVCGMAIFLLFSVFIIISYVLFWGLMIGIALWIIARIKLYFSCHKPQVTNTKHGRIIEHYEI